MKTPEEIIKERLIDCYGFKNADAAECAMTLVDDLRAYYNITELPYLAQRMGKMIKDFERETA